MNELHADIKNMLLQTVRRMETRGFRAKALEWSAGEETLKRRHMHRRWAKNNRPGHQSGAVGQTSIENELLCCVVAVASAGTAVTAAASASAAVVTALA